MKASDNNTWERPSDNTDHITDELEYFKGME